MTGSTNSGCGYPQAMVDRTPAFDKKRKGKFSSNQVMSKRGIIRPSKRKKAKFL